MAYQQPYGQPPQQPGQPYPSAPPQYPPAQQYPTATYPQIPQQQPMVQPMAQPMVQPMAQPMVQPMVQPMAQPMPAGPQAPSGYSVLDAFKEGNVVQLVPRSTGYPLMVKASSVSGNGSFVNKDSLFKVIVPDKANPKIIKLQNMNWVGLHIAVKSHKVQTTKEDNKHCQLRVEALPDNYVVFEALHSPGEFVAIGSNGAPPDKVKGLGSTDKETQFFVRVERQKHPYSPLLQTPFGRPSIANQLRDGSVIQLYLKSTNTYLSINSNGIVLNSTNPGDKHTFFELIDRGMGIVSLHSHLYPGFRLRMNGNVLEGKGDPTLVADWRLKENMDGTVQFESVVSPGLCVGINSPHGLQKDLNIFLVNIQKFGGAETITKSPLN